MEIVAERVCGIDVHKEEVTACLLTGHAGQKTTKQIRRFRTFTRDLVAMAEWLKANEVTHVGMESTGIYWRPIYAVLEEFTEFELIVGNAQHMKSVPGRKTDVKDAEWIALLIRNGLVRKSFVPPRDIRDLRDFTRYRRTLVQAHAAERNRLLKVLEMANIKLGSVASDVFGKSGMAMLNAIADGKANAEELAGLALGVLRKKRVALISALDGRVRAHHRFLLRIQLQRLAEIDETVAQLDACIEERVKPYEDLIVLLCTIPGMKRVSAAAILAEVGPDMAVFETADRLSAWGGVAPGNNESAGKHRPESRRKGNVHLCTALVEVSHAARNKKDSFLRSFYWRVKVRRGEKRAIVALAHKILVISFHVLQGRQPYTELGAAYHDQANRRHATAAALRRLQGLGYDVTLTEKKAA
ncbi:MAG TPA: IS110 family transposase [Thermoanaerobaculia bacterium]|nr:IS110 family transposase [Thermoanaerobaculia bacterium]